jgi:protein associated with RNAse G/E
VTTPATWVTPDHVTMVDLEIDVHRLPDGTVEILDEEEFAQRCAEVPYPTLFAEVAPRVGKLLAARLAAGDEPFRAVGEALIASLLS